jgi:hypothetical protein
MAAPVGREVLRTNILLLRGKDGGEEVGQVRLDQVVGDVGGEAGLEVDGGLVVRWLTTASAVG